MNRLFPRLLLAIGVVATGLVALFLLQDHLVGDFTSRIGVAPSYRAWRDPVALVCACAAIAVALRIAIGRLHRLELAVAVAGCALAASVYVHQRGVHVLFVCPPGDHCLSIPFRPDFWHDSRSLPILAVGFAAAIVSVLPYRWIERTVRQPVVE